MTPSQRIDELSKRFKGNGRDILKRKIVRLPSGEFAPKSVISAVCKEVRFCAPLTKEYVFDVFIYADSEANLYGVIDDLMLATLETDWTLYDVKIKEYNIAQLSMSCREQLEII